MQRHSDEFAAFKKSPKIEQGRIKRLQKLTLAKKKLAAPTVEINTYAAFVAADDFSRESIVAVAVAFADAIDISSSIVVGRFQHDRFIGFNERNDLHMRLDWAYIRHAENLILFAAVKLAGI